MTPGSIPRVFRLLFTGARPCTPRRGHWPLAVDARAPDAIAHLRGGVKVDGIRKQRSGGFASRPRKNRGTDRTKLRDPDALQQDPKGI